MVRISSLLVCAGFVAANLENSREDILATQAAADAVEQVEAMGASVALQDKVAAAVGEAAGDVVKLADASVPTHLVEKAESKAEVAYKSLVNDGTSAMQAAEEASEVAMGSLDEVLPQDIAQDTQEAAEGAAVIAAKSVSDNPDQPLLAEREARMAVNNVVTAEDVAAKAAQAGFIAGESASDGVPLEQKQAVAAGTAAVQALQAGHSAPPAEVQAAKAKASSTFESLVEGKAPVGLAAREAAQAAIGSMDADAPQVVQQASEAAAASAADVVAKHESQSDETLAEGGAAAGEEAAAMVSVEKEASRAAVAGAMEVESQPASLRGTRAEREASAAAAAAVEAIKSDGALVEEVAEQAQQKASGAFTSAMDDGKLTVREAAEDAAEAAIEVVSSKATAPSDDAAKATIAAAEAAAAAEEHPENQGVILSEATSQAANNVALSDVDVDAGQKVEGHSEVFMVLPWIAFIAFIVHRIYLQMSYVSPHKAALIEARVGMQASETEFDRIENARDSDYRGFDGVSS